VQCFCRKGAPDEAKETLDEMVARGYLPSVAAFSAVVGCLCKRGRVTRAMDVFDTMRAVGSEPTIRTYNSLIGGLCYVGRLEEARDLLNKLKDSPKQTMPSGWASRPRFSPTTRCSTATARRGTC
uniref:Pentacotripeptide-repeat region of PRORP domain-containing protein n=1 Tax=Aegilops tauschii subsp. strangulata TaxID=200361 RepID=A0A453I5F2_AEGTS